MKNRTRRSLIAAGALGAVGLLPAGVAAAADEVDGHGYPSTQSPTQVVGAVEGLAGTAGSGFADAADSHLPGNRPDGVNGTETEFPALNPGYVEGPAGGLLNGPFE